MTDNPQEPIYVAKPSLPPLEDMQKILADIWERGTLTNNGPLHKELEKKLCEYLGVEFISLFSNGTQALITSLKALNVKGEVITTPYSFVATSHSLLWSNITPVFVDIDPDTFNLDPNKIETAITDKTTAIMPVHCYGIPCDVDRIESIAAKYELKVIYDAAHSFGVECHCGSLLNHGDLSVVSFHATKVFNTFEGGAIISKNKRTKANIDRLKNFGFVSETEVMGIGLNGKMNEFQAAVGILQLKTIDADITKRGRIAEIYRKLIDKIEGIEYASLASILRQNNSYFPILVKPSYKLERDQLYNKLKSQGIHARRYFYPLITNLPMYREMASACLENLPIANKIAEQVICLPIYPELKQSDINRIINALTN